MEAELPKNFICRPYRALSVQEVDLPLEAEAITGFLMGRRVYRRTEFLVLVHGEDRALVRVRQVSEEEVLNPVEAVAVVALPAEVAFVRDPTIDTANASQLARGALESGQEARVYVIEGRFQHVNLIVEPSPIRLRVVEVIPPLPPKLTEMTKQVIDFDEDLPPIGVEEVPIDLRELAARNPAPHFLFPCRCSDMDVAAQVDFLDAAPQEQADWTLVGCERSRQIHAALYGSDPARQVDMCPRHNDPDGGSAEATLLKCCLLERGVELEGSRAVVPWGANLEEIRSAITSLVGRTDGAVVGAAP